MEEEGRTQFVVQWEEHAMQLATRLGYLLEHQSLVDVTLMCNTHTLRVHRAVLAACSPYFERQLGNHPLIVLKDMKFSVLKSLVEFMYCGETSVSEDNLSPLLEAAKFFEVKGLAAMTKESVCHNNAAMATSIGSNNVSPATPSTPQRTVTRGWGPGRPAGCRGRGRGRGRPPLTSKVSSPTESAQILLSLSTPPQQSQLVTTSKNVKIDVAGAGLSDPGKVSALSGRRRGRRRSAYNAAIRERILAGGDSTSPLLSSLLTSSTTSLDKDVPVLYENGQGELVSLSETPPSLLTDSDPNLNSTHAPPAKLDSELNSLKGNVNPEVDSDPEAVVLFEVSGNKKVQKCVLSVGDINMLKVLNERLSQQKKELADMTRDDIATLAENPAVTELKGKISDTMAQIAKIMPQFHGFKGIKDLSEKELFDNEDSDDPKAGRLVELEFIDGNGDKIEEFKVEVEDSEVKKDPMVWEDELSGGGADDGRKDPTALDAMMPIADNDYIVAYAAEEEVAGEEYTVVYGAACSASDDIITPSSDEYAVISDYAIEQERSPPTEPVKLELSDDLMDSS